jgi:hypothetical protein
MTRSTLAQLRRYLELRGGDPLRRPRCPRYHALRPRPRLNPMEVTEMAHLGSHARAKKLSAKQRSDQARAAALARWRSGERIPSPDPIDDTRTIELWRCLYDAPCRAKNCKAKATVMMRIVDTGGRG